LKERVFEEIVYTKEGCINAALENFVVLILNLRPYFVLFSALISEITLQH